MKDSDADVRKQAMQALTRLGAPLAYETLVAALKDEDGDVRQQAAFSLGQMGDSRAVDPLIGALKDVEPDVRQQAAFGLSQLKAASAVPALQGALKDEDEDVRQQALFALSQIGDRSAVPAFMLALKDTSEDVREQALFALSQLGDASAVPAILPLLAKDESEDVRQQAAFAFESDRRRECRDRADGGAQGPEFGREPAGDLRALADCRWRHGSPRQARQPRREDAGGLSSDEDSRTVADAEGCRGADAALGRLVPERKPGHEPCARARRISSPAYFFAFSEAFAWTVVPMVTVPSAVAALPLPSVHCTVTV